MTGSIRILVVDDEPVVCDLLEEVLEAEGYAVVSTPSALRALDMLRQEPDIGLLLTDLMMPEINGLDLVREARRLRPELIPVVVTGFATLETARASVKEGVYDYVLKPFNLSEIKQAVAKAVERRRLADENSRLRALAGLFDFGETLSTIREEAALLRFVLDAALDRVEGERGSVMVKVGDGAALEVAAAVGLPPEARGAVTGFDKGVAGWVARHRRALLVRNLADHPELGVCSLRLREKSFISVPLEGTNKGVSRPTGCASGDGEVLAVLNVTRKRRGGAFTEGDLQVLSIVASQAAVALENIRLVRHVEAAHVSTLQSMALLLETRDLYTHGHSQRVRHYVVTAARRLGLSDAEVAELDLGAALHDIGKVGVNDTILNKPGALTAEEWALIQRHPQMGYEVLVPVGVLTPRLLELVRSHHERIDGRGYPDGRGDGVLSDAVKLLAVADAYDAMSSSRAYRPAMAQQAILEELHRCSGTQFDREVAGLFAELVERGCIGPLALPVDAAV